jgi:hypothetical protein
MNRTSLIIIAVAAILIALVIFAPSQVVNTIETWGVLIIAAAAGYFVMTAGIKTVTN